MKTKVKSAVRKFFYESFRAHSKDEYAEIFMRGTEDNEGANTVYPWFYLRVFAVLAVAYAVYALINSTMPGGGDYETLYFVGGAFMDIGFLVLLYELYPYKDFSILSLTVVLTIGGSFADFISAFFYHFHSYETLANGWKLALIAGVSEEISKAVPAILCVVILGKKRPQAAFVIGAAVGTWFSITENAYYIHRYPYSEMVITATVRAFGCMFSHAVWTAIICYAFAKLKKPLINVKFYVTVLFCMALHFCIDMPLYSYILILFAEAAVCGLAAFITGVIIIVKERRRALGKRESAPAPPLAFEQAANITLASLGIATCALMLVLSIVFNTVGYKDRVFENEKDFKLFAQNGYSLNTNANREYDEDVLNSFEQYEKGRLTVAEQSVFTINITYIYHYELRSVYEDENGEISTGPPYSDPDKENENKLILTMVNVSPNDDEEQIYYTVTRIFDDYTLSYYPLNEELNKGYVVYENGNIIFRQVIKKLDRQSVTAICATCVSAAAWGTAFIAIKRRKSKMQTAASSQ